MEATQDQPIYIPLHISQDTGNLNRSGNNIFQQVFIFVEAPAKKLSWIKSSFHELQVMSSANPKLRIAIIHACNKKLLSDVL
jgi:uncharacterized protein YllA (UPF0747 family)